jgi:hypothetical protein
VLAGDQEQLAAVEGGGAMRLLAGKLGYAQLAEPVRFTAAWERDASLRLRQGDPTALDDYDQHGRIHGAPADEAMDQAVSKELRLVRLGAANAELDATRAEAEASAARKAGDHERGGRHEFWATSYRAMRDRYQAQEETFAKTMADRAEWEHATEHTRHLAIAADAELRRRHPDQKIEPLRSAEPAPAGEAEREQLTLAPDENIGQVAPGVRDLAAQRQAFTDKLGERQTLKVPSEDPDFEDLGHAFPAWNPPGKDAILQPPKPEITPSAKILELSREPEPGREAAD